MDLILRPFHSRLFIAMPQSHPFDPGTLLPSIRARTSAALRSGKLLPIETEERIVEDGGVAFLVKQATNLRRKEADAANRERAGKSASSREKQDNPFLPYDADLCVGVISDTHVALLNKFNVLENHLLVVTRAFEEQESTLTGGDFRALCRCMAEFPSLGFYNSGELAGASQGHKHLQVVPLPLARSAHCAPVPIEPLLNAIGKRGDFPFRHALRRMDAAGSGWQAWAEEARRCYHEVLQELGVDINAEGLATTPYNLLMTRHWMLMVPRSQEHGDGISINALGFAGSFFVKDETEMERLIEAGPLAVLREVGQPAPQD